MKVAFMTKQVSDCNQLSKIGKNGYPSLLSSFCRWRLGNQMSSLATGYALWKLFKIRNFIVGDQYETLKSVFDLPVPKTNHIFDWPYHVWNESMKNLYKLNKICVCLVFKYDNCSILILQIFFSKAIAVIFGYSRLSLLILGCYLKNKKFENNVVWTGYALIHNQFILSYNLLIYLMILKCY